MRRRHRTPGGGRRTQVGVKGFFQVFLVLFLLQLVVAGGSITVIAPTSLSIEEVSPPVVFQPGDASSYIGPNSTSAYVYLYGSQTTTVDVVSNPGFTGTPDPWFYAENDPYGLVSAAYDVAGGYVYMTGSVPAYWPIVLAVSGILQQVTIPATSTVYGSVDWAYTLDTTLLFGGVDLYVVVLDANWNIVAFQQIQFINRNRNAPAWRTFNFDFSGQLPGPGSYYVGLLAYWRADFITGYTAAIYMDNFHLYVDDPSLYGAVVERSAVRIVNLHAVINWTASLRVESYSYSGLVNWVNVSLTNVLGYESNPEISFREGTIVSNDTGPAQLSYSGSINDTLYLTVEGDLDAPGAFLELNMTLVLDSGTGVVLEYPLVLRVEQP